MKPTNWDAQAMRQEHFKTLIHAYLKPAQAIQSPEFLKGRTQTLRQMEIALGSPGRHVFIHGLRGVGKTSLAQTGAFLFHPADSTPIIFGCSRDVNFYSCIQGNAAEPILWAVADRTSLNPQFKEIYESYKRIIREIKWPELTENQFRSRL